VKRGVLRVAALVGEVFRGFVFRANLDQLWLLRVLFAEVDAESTLSGLYLLHGYLRRVFRINRGSLSSVATLVP